MTSIWSEHYTKDGRAYYYNRKTKQSAWEKPADFDGEPAAKPAAKAGASSASGSASASASSSAETEKKAASGGGGADAGDWEELWDPKNERHYYYNRATRKTQWQKPEGVTIKPYAGATTAGASKKDHKHKKSEKASSDAASGSAAASSAASTEAEESASTGDEKPAASASMDDKVVKTKRSGSGSGEQSTAHHGGEKAEKSGEHAASGKGKDKVPTPSKKSAISASPRKKQSGKHQQQDAAEVAVTAAAASSRSPKRSLVVDEEDDGDGDLVEEEDEGESAPSVQRKRKKLSRRDLQAELTERKRQRRGTDKRMIIGDDEDAMTREANRPIEEQDTEDGKEATRLLQYLSKPDAIMEENVLNLINGFLRAHNAANGPEILVEKLSSSYRGHAQMVGLVASWLDALPVSKTSLENKIAFDVAEGSVVQKNNGASWDPASDILYQHLQEIITQQYDPKLVSNVLSGSATEPEWLTQMLGDRKWRHMLIELAETHKTCSLLQYAIRRISDAGHHKEIASMSSATAFFSVFNGILLDAFCRIPFASDEEARDDLNALKKICCQSAYSFVYAEELLCAMDSKLFHLQQDPASKPAQRAEYRTVRAKLNHVRFELQETTIDKFGAKIESFHPLRRRYLYDSNQRLGDAILSIVKTKKCTEAAAETLAKEYRTPSAAPPVAHLRDPLVFRALLDPLFNPAVALSTAFAQNCVHLLAYAACAKDERGILHTGNSSGTSVGVDASELEKAKEALQEASTACRDDHTLSFNMNQTGVVEKLTSVMGVPLASMGVLHWIEVTLTSPAFFNSSLLHICFPSLLRILKASIQLHVAQWPIAFRVLVTSLRLHPDVNPVKALELKRESLRSMVFMIRSGYVLPVLEYILTNTAELDQALLRNFITMLFAQIAPPYSAKFVVELTKMLTHPKVQNALKSCPSECKLKLSSFMAYCKKNAGVLSSDQLHALASSLDGL